MYKLKQKRIEAGLSQTELSEKSGVHIRMIQQYEADSPTAHRDINQAQAMRVYKLACALGVDISEILEAEDAGADM